MKRFLQIARSEKGKGDVITFPYTTLILFFVVFTGLVLHQVVNVRAVVAMAAREGGRQYGITHNISEAQNATWNVLVNNGVVKSIDTVGGSECRVKAWSFTDDGNWAKCSITYGLPNPFQNINKLLLINTAWQPNGFTFNVTGAGKHEITP